MMPWLWIQTTWSYSRLLLKVYEELLLAIREAEEGLIHLKRSRLLEEADSILAAQGNKSAEEDVKVEPLDSNHVEMDPTNVESYKVGSKCRFRHTDGRWYNGQIVGLDKSSSARVSFLTPTSENMLVCKFYLQERCRFGSNCRLSHGVDVPISSLKRYIPTIWQQSLVGSSIWATADTDIGVWRRAELESWDEKLGLGQVVFRDDGSSRMLGRHELSLSEFAQLSEEEESCSDTETSYSSDPEDESEGVGFMEATNLQRGIQTDTAVFTKWENHTRGIASKMMANMGYREGMGLGASGQGILDPISVKVLPSKQSLDHAFDSNENNEKKNENSQRKRSRGGKRKREKKHAAAARAAKDAGELEPNMFTFINHQLAAHERSGGKKQGKGAVVAKNEDRQSIIAYEEEVKDLRIQVKKLEEMVARNLKEKAVFEAFSRKLTETKKALADVEAAQASASSVVSSKEKEKRWLKF